MGTVKFIDTAHIEVQATDGHTATLYLNKDTRYLRGTAPISRDDIKAGERVVVIGVEDKEGMEAEEVRLAPAGQSEGAVLEPGAKTDSSSGLAAREVLAAYEALSRALVADDLATARKDGTHLAERAHAADQDEIAEHAAGLAESDSLEKAREHFKVISEEAIELAAGREGYYVMTCPMAKADWVQSNKEVANPYMGQKMPHCGTIKQAAKQ